MAPELRHLTIFISPFGRYYFCRALYGISSMPEIYQTRISLLLQGIKGFVCLTGDILVIGRDQQEHDSRLHVVLCRLQKSNVKLNDKLELSVSELKYVGHLVSAAGTKPDTQKIAAIIVMAPPTSVAEVRCFLGMVNQFAKFSSRLPKLSAPIRELLRKHRTWSWACPQEAAFQKIKEDICSTPTLALYNLVSLIWFVLILLLLAYAAPFFRKQSDESWHPVTFASRSMTDVERQYAQIEKEALTIT